MSIARAMLFVCHRETFHLLANSPKLQRIPSTPGNAGHKGPAAVLLAGSSGFVSLFKVLLDGDYFAGSKLYC